MKKFFSFIRWKYVIKMSIFAAILIIFFVFCFDLILAWTIQKYGSQANGAKVEVSELHTKLSKGQLTIGRLQVTNADKPMENIVEAGPLNFALNPFELLKKKVIITDASLLGLAFNTPRKTSGALPKVFAKKDETPGVVSKLADKYEQQFSLNLDGLKSDARAKLEFDPKQLNITKQSEELKQSATTLPDRWKSKTDSLDVDGRLKKIQAELDEIKKTPTSGSDAIKAIPESLKKLKATKAELDQLKNDVNGVKSGFTSEANAIKDGIKNLSAAKQKDVNDILGRFNLDFANPNRLLEGIIGPTVLSRYKTAMFYVNKIRAHLPSKVEAASLPPPKRFKGVDVPFPTPPALPKFLLAHAALSGAYSGIDANGNLANVTSSPSQLGKPVTLDLRGNRGAQNFVLDGVFDHTADVGRDGFTLDASGLDIKDVITEGPFAAAMAGGNGSAKTKVMLTGFENIDGQIDFHLSHLKFDRAVLMQQMRVAESDNLRADFLNNLARSMETLPDVAITAKLTGTAKDPDIRLSSNLDNIFANVIKQSVGNVVAKQRAELEAKLDGMIKDKSAEITEKLKSVEGKLSPQLADLDRKIQEKISQASGVNLSSTDGGGSVLDDQLNKLFKKK